ncbi:MAG: DUF885 domain-containing protein [Pseudomonadota bacterium]
MRKVLALCFVLLAPLASIAGNAEQQARALFNADWQWRLQTQPEFATTVGDYRFNARLSDASPAASVAATNHVRAMLDSARRIDRTSLSEAAATSLDIFIDEHELELKAASFYPYNPQPITLREGIHLSFAQLVAQMPFATERDYRNYLSRIDALPAHIDGVIAQLQEGMRSGWTVPRAALHGVPEALRKLRENIETGPLAAPFRAIPATIPAPAREKLFVAGPAALRARAAPSLAKLEDFLLRVYLPAARESIAASATPGGTDWYGLLVRRHTSTGMTPAQVHELGKREMARLAEEVHAAMRAAGFYGSFSEFVEFLGTDQRFYYSKPEQLLEHYRAVVSRATRVLPTLFASAPLEPLFVKALPDEHQGTAFYEAGAAERPAALLVNTTLLDTRAKWEVEALALHEGLPGHHLQTARAHAAQLPPFRQRGWNVAYGEGWALYAESLGPELGFLRDPYSRFGQLNGELFRAARLVVDTGIHAMGWSRQQAIDYLGANTANAPSDNALEVDRYIAWPAQALGYKVGQMKFRALREKAQNTLGDRFDIRQFHSALLDQGPMPLALLERQVERWLDRQQ